MAKRKGTYKDIEELAKWRKVKVLLPPWCWEAHSSEANDAEVLRHFE